MHNRQENNFNQSNIESSSINDRLSNSFVSTTQTVTEYQLKIPPISQPLLSRYRNQKLKIDLISSKKWDANILIDFLCGKQTDTTISMCNKCQRSQHSNICSFILQMIQEKYDWKNDIKFKSSYEFYNKKKMSIFLTDQQIEYRLISKFNTLGVALLQNHKLLLVRIIRNYIKHTIYYGEQKRLTLESDYYFWFLVGIYYHVGVPKYFNDFQSLPKDTVGVHEPLMFWMLDTVMKRLTLCTRQNLRKVAYQTLQYCQFFYGKQCKSLSLHYDIPLQEIFNEWTNQGMMGYMGIEFIGFYIKCIMKQGFEYIQKTIMSYFEKRTIKLDKDEVANYHHQNTLNQGNNPLLNEQSRKNKKQQIMKVLLDSNQEWPGIFFNTNVYDLKG